MLVHQLLRHASRSASANIGQDGPERSLYKNVALNNRINEYTGVYLIRKKTMEETIRLQVVIDQFFLKKKTELMRSFDFTSNICRKLPSRRISI